jgi:transcriptional regulator of NAD metabolism
MKRYQLQIGDGKLPNKYWVFQHDQKYKRVKEDGHIILEVIAEDTATKECLIGEYKTYEEALQAVDNKAYLPNVVIEDRISGQVFEQMCIQCQECGKEEYESFNDIAFTKEKLGESFK